jgi:hypothetical protein
MSDLDLDAITAKWLQPCGSCDGGLPMNCTHPTDDYRPVMASLVAEVERLRKQLAEAQTTIRAFVKPDGAA